MLLNSYTGDEWKLFLHYHVVVLPITSILSCNFPLWLLIFFLCPFLPSAHLPPSMCPHLVHLLPSACPFSVSPPLCASLPSLFIPLSFVHPSSVHPLSLCASPPSVLLLPSVHLSPSSPPLCVSPPFMWPPPPCVPLPWPFEMSQQKMTPPLVLWRQAMDGSVRMALCASLDGMGPGTASPTSTTLPSRCSRCSSASPWKAGQTCYTG